MAVFGCFRLVLMDIRMPIMDGIQAIKKIRSLPDKNKIKAVAVTASVNQETEEYILNQGFDGYLGKPLDAKLLFNMIGELLGLQFIEEFDEKCRYEMVMIEALTLCQCVELNNILEVSLEVGDIGSLEKALLQKRNDYSETDLLDYILILCRDMCIEKLELVCEKLIFSIDQKKQSDIRL